MLAKKFALGFGIAIILPMMVHYAVRTFSPPPQYKDYVIEGYWQKYQSATPAERTVLDKENKALQEKRETREKVFQRHLFYVAVPVGLIAIIVGSLVGIQAIGSGLMFGGIFSVTDGYCWYWSQLDDAMKFGSLLVAFIVLIVIGYRKMADAGHQKRQVVTS